MLLLLIPIGMIGNSIDERREYSEQVARDIARSSAYSQTLVGPVLVVPYSKKERYWTLNEAKEKVFQERVIEDNLYFLPERFRLSGDMTTESRQLGIYTARLYHADNSIDGHFTLPLNYGIKTNLALSLHSANNEKRSAIMPINDSNNLEMLADALNYWYDKTGIRPTLEYTVIEGVNDGVEEEKELVIFARKFPSKINLIEYNPISLADYQPTGRLDAFAAALEKQKLIVHVRRSRGKDIDAACGQLANQLS